MFQNLWFNTLPGDSYGLSLSRISDHFILWFWVYPPGLGTSSYRIKKKHSILIDIFLVSDIKDSLVVIFEPNNISLAKGSEPHELQLIICSNWTSWVCFVVFYGNLDLHVHWHLWVIQLVWDTKTDLARVDLSCWTTWMETRKGKKEREMEVGGGRGRGNRLKCREEQKWQTQDHC